MSKIFVIVEYYDGKFNVVIVKIVSVVVVISGVSVDVVVLVFDLVVVVVEVVKISGVVKVLIVVNVVNVQVIVQVLVLQIVQLVEGYIYVFGLLIIFGKDLMLCVVVLLGVNQVFDLMIVEGSYIFKCLIYVGNVIIIVEVLVDQIVVVIVCVVLWLEVVQGGSVVIEVVSVDVVLLIYICFVGFVVGVSDCLDLQSVKCVVFGGRGVGFEENFKVIFQLVDKFGVVVGVLCVVVDVGYVFSDLQVGQIGKIIVLELYVVVGISGVIQYLIGIKDVGMIVVINKDLDLLIFEIVDIGLVGDLFVILLELEVVL